MCIPCIVKGSLYIPYPFIITVCERFFPRYRTMVETNEWLLIENQQTVLSFRSVQIETTLFWNLSTISDVIGIPITVTKYDGWMDPYTLTRRSMIYMNMFLYHREQHKELWKFFGRKCKKWFISIKQRYFYDIHIIILYIIC